MASVQMTKSFVSSGSAKLDQFFFPSSLKMTVNVSIGNNSRIDTRKRKALITASNNTGTDSTINKKSSRKRKLKNKKNRAKVACHQGTDDYPCGFAITMAARLFSLQLTMTKYMGPKRGRITFFAPFKHGGMVVYSKRSHREDERE